MTAFGDALLLQAGLNTALVSLGAAALGAVGGAVGSFVLMRRRSLISDAAGHATLPGLALAFILMVFLGGDGRWLPGLMIGAAASALLGIVAVHAIRHHTRLPEDAAIGAVLSVSFGGGIVLLTVIQTLDTGRQAGLERFLLGSAAGMLRQEVMVIVALALAAGLAVFLLRRPLMMLCFDENHAAMTGVRTRWMDAVLSALLLTVVVIGLKVVGLVLSVALVTIPAVAARFWTDRFHRMIPIAAGIGAVGGYIGAALSASAQDLPTGAVIVLTLFSIFAVSFLFAPRRGLLASVRHHRNFRRRVHIRQGLLALDRDEPIYDATTLKLLRQAGWIRGDGTATPSGREAARMETRNETLWSLYQQCYPGQILPQDQRHLPISTVLPADQLHELEKLLAETRPAYGVLQPGALR